MNTAGGWPGMNGAREVSISHPDGAQPQHEPWWFNHSVKPSENLYQERFQRFGTGDVDIKTNWHVFSTGGCLVSHPT